jgi:hypothetical protein
MVAVQVAMDLAEKASQLLVVGGGGAFRVPHEAGLAWWTNFWD